MKINKAVNAVFLGGETLQELKFPEEWSYDVNLCRWQSENQFITITPRLSFKETGRHLGDPYKEYMYITDKMLADINYEPLSWRE